MSENINIYSSDSNKIVNVNNSTPIQSPLRQKNFIKGLKNAQNLLSGLVQSLQITNECEERLLKCKATHSHSHTSTEWLDINVKEQKSTPDIAKSTIKHKLDFTESCPTMNIMCLQHEYEELIKQFKALLQAYAEQSKTLNARNKSMERLELKMRLTKKKIAKVHRTLISVGEKYLDLKREQMEMLKEYDHYVKHLMSTMRGLKGVATSACQDLDSHIKQTMSTEKDATVSQLLAKSRICNRLYLENLKLKSLIDELAPGIVEWPHDSNI